MSADSIRGSAADRAMTRRPPPPRDAGPPAAPWLAAILDGADEAILVLDADDRVLAAGHAAARLFDRAQDRIVGQPAAGLIDGAAIAEFRGRAPADSSQPFARRVGRSGAATADLTLRIVAGDGDRGHLVCFLREIPSLREIPGAEAAHGERGAAIDPVTGLANRAGLLAQMQAASYPGAVPPSDLHLTALHLVGFDVLATSIGRRAGGLLLAEVAARLRDVVVPGEILARIGEAEFAVAGGGRAATDCAEALHRAFDEPFAVGRGTYYLTPAIGIAPHAASAEDALADAELACRADQGPTIRHFDAALRTLHHDRLEIETALHQALRSRSGEVSAAYQPVYDLRTGMAAGCEALARWHHPTRGDVPPATFVPIAENAGLVGLLGEHVCRLAARALAGWNRGRARQGEPPAFVSINLSARQFADPALVERLQRILGEAPVEPAQVQLELTESCLLGPGNEALATLERLRRLGFTLYIDDFGVGYSNFSYLQQLPLDGLKIDRSFVGAMTTSPRAFDIVRMIIELAHGMNLPVVAEGIENLETCAALRRLDCDFVQGLLLGAPGPNGPAAGVHPLLAQPAG
ncbi:EAL domain-containing protein (putative c-di-GMP-specific phosphodiesterase class I) [Stella humosa]|uniref:EAL domain-containing protein (Putative c-di-GMP-specific phosphodiesterase class I) n=1 Tax=Stella humosa TaxID=94 RepID=A0A3N1M761_9PROT|nr:EAL domain-containing protein [Stella humosa]ROQ03344.1 EAL domain-containing protein (putative c-di-GMP-specific phosphodiesterase class I) [Stella humosa]BBK29631.1 hypothetical protein STHU_02650 [Stella humosa]